MILYCNNSTSTALREFMQLRQRIYKNSRNKYIYNKVVLIFYYYKLVTGQFYFLHRKQQRDFHGNEFQFG